MEIQVRFWVLWATTGVTQRRNSEIGAIRILGSVEATSLVSSVADGECDSKFGMHTPFSRPSLNRDRIVRIG